MKNVQVHEGTAHPTNTLFAAANSGKGFVSFYESVFCRKEIKRRYIIKGGPGTGKSSFMREVAAYAESRGMTVEYYRCSSDPDSLDGIVIDGRIAMLDGTAPHSVDTDIPGARDEIINLGEFWDGENLGAYYNDIVSLSSVKSNCYRKAYRFLSAAMEIEEINRELIMPSVRKEKMRSAVKRQLRSIADGTGFAVTAGLAASIGMRGSVRFDTYEKQAKRLFVIDDHYGIGSVFLLYVIEEAKEKGCKIQVSYQPVIPSLPDAVMFADSGDCFVLGEYGDREADVRINMRRFADADKLSKVKTEYRINKRLFEALMCSATEALEDAGKYHFELEKIYVSCMDFDSERKFIRSFCQKIR